MKVNNPIKMTGNITPVGTDHAFKALRLLPLELLEKNSPAQRLFYIYEILAYKFKYSEVLKHLLSSQCES